MKNKSWFNKNLYIEGLRTLKVMGGILLTLTVLFSILYPMNLFAMPDETQYIAENAFGSYITQMTFLFYFVMVLAVPVLTLRVFSFYTTRNGSDFFQSIPHKKQCLFLSYTAAALTWVIACILIPGIISYLMYVFAGYSPAGFASFLIIELHIFVASLLVMSAICLACSITGTILTNIITTGIILFMPRLFIVILRIILTETTNYIIPTNGFWFGTIGNLVVDSIARIEDNINHLFAITPMIYTLVLALIYFVLATFLFIKRPSEIANRPTLGKRMQTVICILIGLAVSLLPILYISGLIYADYEYYDSSFSIFVECFTLYVFVVLAMVIYELLTTRKVKNLLSIIPRGIIIAVINVIIIAGLSLSRNWIMDYAPDASEISYVSCPNLYQVTNYYAVSYDSDYIDTRLGEYQSHNEELKEIVFDALKNSNIYYANDTNYITFKFKSGVLTHTRNVYLPSDKYKRVKELLFEDSEFCALFTKVPTANKNSFSLHSSNETAFSQDQLLEIYNSAKEEIEAYDPVEWTKNCVNDSGYTSLSLSFTVDSVTNYERYTIPINSYLPKTYTKCMDMINASAKYSIADFLSSEQFKEDNECLSITTTPTPDGYEQYGDIFYSELTSDKIASFVDSIQENEGKSIDTSSSDSTILQITFYIMSDDSIYERTSKYICIPTSEYDKVKSLFS